MQNHEEHNDAHNDGHNDAHNTNSEIPPTPGQAEGSANPDEQSQGSPAPQQTDQAEGEEEDAGK